MARRLGPCSLRGRLLVWLTLPLIALSVGLLLEAYVNAQATAKRLFDKTLLAVTLAISESVLRSDGDLLSKEFLEVVASSSRELMYYHVLGPDAAFVSGYQDAPAVPRDVELPGGAPLFFDAEYDGQPVRAAALRLFVAEPRYSGWLLIRVWQTVEERRALAREMMLRAAGRAGALLILAALAGWYGLRRGLRPLDRLEAEVSRRGPGDLEPIQAAVPSEVRQVVSALDRLLARLKTALAEREKFITNASHQLRTPLAGLLAQADMASRAKDPDALEASVRGIALSVRGVARLADQLLSLARIEAQGAAMPSDEVDIVALTREAARELAAGALSRGVELAFEAEGDVPRIRGDRLMLGEAVRNLIDNAIRYGASGGRVTLRAYRENGWAIMATIDQGPGIPAAAREKVLHRFVRLAGGVEGSGLGLAIVQDVAERHGGALELADGPQGRGLEARLRLPAPEQAA